MSASGAREGAPPAGPRPPGSGAPWSVVDMFMYDVDVPQGIGKPLRHAVLMRHGTTISRF